MYYLDELTALLRAISNIKIPITVNAETLEIVDLYEEFHAGIDYVAAIMEKFSDAFDCFVQELEAYQEKVRSEEVPEDNEPWAGYHCPCSRQLPGGHRIPWYTSGYQ